MQDLFVQQQDIAGRNLWHIYFSYKILSRKAVQLEFQLRSLSLSLSFFPPPDLEISQAL